MKIKQGNSRKKKENGWNKSSEEEIKGREIEEADRESWEERRQGYIRKNNIWMGYVWSEHNTSSWFLQHDDTFSAHSVLLLFYNTEHVTLKTCLSWSDCFLTKHFSVQRHTYRCSNGVRYMFGSCVSCAGVLSGQSRCLPQFLQPPQDPAEEPGDGEAGRADCHALCHPEGVPCCQIPRVSSRGCSWDCGQKGILADMWLSRVSKPGQSFFFVLLNMS